MDKQTGDTASAQERRDRKQNDRRVLGHVVQCEGARAIISATADDSEGASGAHWKVGRLISINLRKSRIVGLVCDVKSTNHCWADDQENPIEIRVELIGEVCDNPAGGKPLFDRGITAYPHIGAIAHRIRSTDLEAIYDLSGRRNVTLGRLAQDDAIDACIAVDDMLARHFAVLGTTGVGKSTAVALILRKMVEVRPDLRILVFDPHNEFGCTLERHAVRINSATLELPFWMFRLEELCEVIFRGREVVPEEMDALRDLIAAAKKQYRAGSSANLYRRAADTLTADTPVPYRIADLLKMIDDRMGALDGKNERSYLRTLKLRLESAYVDPNYRFMFHSRMIEDTIHETLSALFRVPHGGRPITCFEMAGMPAEIVNSVCSVLARLAFDLAQWSEGRFRLLVLCEEAHRYMPSDPRLGFAPTRHALSRIAKEGRKYGCFLGVVTQRPGELDPTVLSQCSTVFAMRLANEQDQAIVRSAVPDSTSSTLAFLSSLGQREAIAFGEGIAATMRFKFEQVAADQVPGKSRINRSEVLEAEGEIDLSTIIERLRNMNRAPIGEMEGPMPVGPGQVGDADYRWPPSPAAAHSNPLSDAASPAAAAAKLRPAGLDADAGFGLARGGGMFGVRVRA